MTAEHRKTWTNIRAWNGIRSHYPSIQATKAYASDRMVIATVIIIIIVIINYLHLILYEVWITSAHKLSNRCRNSGISSCRLFTEGPYICHHDVCLSPGTSSQWSKEADPLQLHVTRHTLTRMRLPARYCVTNLLSEQLRVGSKLLNRCKCLALCSLFIQCWIHSLTPFPFMLLMSGFSHFEQENPRYVSHSTNDSPRLCADVILFLVPFYFAAAR